MVKPTGIANGESVVCGRKKGPKNDASVSTYGMELAFTKRRKAGVGARGGGAGVQSRL